MCANIIINKDDFYYHRTENKICSNSTQHNHEGFEVYYMKEGKCHYFIDDVSYDIVSGDVVLIPEGTLHGTSYGSKPCTRLLINFNSSIISQKILNSIKGVGHLYRNPSTVTIIDNIFSGIEREYNIGDEISAIALKNYAEALLVIMIRYENEKINHDRNSIIDATIKYIQANYMSTIRLADVAKMLSVSEEHLSRTFKKETTFGFSEYITLIRLQKAEHMLKNEPSRAVTEVAYACGFNDSNYFSFKFKKAYGMTPTELRDGKFISTSLPANHFSENQ